MTKRVFVRRVVGFALVVQFAASCGTARQDQVGVDRRADSTAFEGLEDATVTVGRSTFVVAGYQDDGGVSASILAATDAGPLIAGPTTLGTKHRLQTPEVLELPSGDWVLTAWGCDTVPTPPESTCGDNRLFVFVVGPNGDGREVGSIPAVEQSTFSIAGASDDTHVLIAIGRNEVPVGAHTLADNVEATYTERYMVFSMTTGEATELPWTPPPLIYNPVSSSFTPSTPKPHRSTCLVNGSLTTIDSISSSDHVTSTVTSVSVEKPETPVTFPIDLPKGYTVVESFCGTSPSLRILAIADGSKALSVFRLDPSGKLGGPITATLEEDVQALETGPSSALVRTGKTLTAEQAQQALGRGTDAEAQIRSADTFLGFTNDTWHAIKIVPGEGEQIWISDDGRSALVRSALGYRAEQL